MKGFVIGIVVLVALVAGYFAVVLHWSYSSGERAGWVQKFSNKGWLCKTWEGELALVSLPGTSVEKFLFTVRDDAVAAQVNKVMGQRVSLHYEQKVGFEVAMEMPGGDYAIVEREGVAIHLFEDAGRTHSPSALHIFTDRIEELHTELAARGAWIAQAIETKPWGNRDFRVGDESGNEIKFTVEFNGERFEMTAKRVSN